MAESSSNRLKTLWEKEKLLITSNFSFSHSVFKRLILQTRKNQGLFGKGLKVALQIVGQKFYKSTKNSSLYSQSLLIFIHKSPVVESYLTTREIRDLLRPSLTPMGITVYFYMSSSLIYTLKIHRRSFKYSVR